MGRHVIQIGEKFNKLTVISKSDKKTGGNSYYICKCDCGETREVVGWRLTNGEIKACHNCSKLFKDMTGKKFGKLTVINITSKRTVNREIIWHCKCDCGNECDVVGTSLRNGHTTSCGCINYSIGEKNIENILQQNNISYIREYKPIELQNKRFDFALLDKNNKIYRLIEFDGRQHYDINTKYFSQQQVESDKIKNEWAKEKGIPLVRINYKYRDQITLELLLSDTFII